MPGGTFGQDAPDRWSHRGTNPDRSWQGLLVDIVLKKYVDHLKRCVIGEEPWPTGSNQSTTTSEKSYVKAVIFRYLVVHVDDVDSGGCTGLPRVIYRTYLATDTGGNFTQCTQTISVVAAALPGDIIDFHVGPTNITLTATGTTNAMPEYSTNLLAVPQLWLAITQFNNAHLFGTNVMIFDIPDTNAPVLYLRIKEE